MRLSWGKVLGFLFVAIGAGTLIGGAMDLVAQHRLLRSGTSAQAEVVENGVRERRHHRRRGSDWTGYVPWARYRYEVDGRTYESDRIHFKSWETSDFGLAHLVKDQFPRGATIVAWYDPDNPSRAVLVKEYLFEPYGVMVLPWVLMAVGVWYFLGEGSPARRPKPPRRVKDDLWQVLPRRNIAGKQTASLLAAGAWLLIGLGGPWLYFFHAPQPWGPEAWIVGGLYGAAGAIPLGFATYYSILRSNIGDAMLYVSRDVFALGGAVEVVLDQRPKQRIEIEKIELDLIHEVTVETQGRKGKGTSTRDGWTERKVLRGRSTLQSRQSVKLPARFELPLDQEPTTPHGHSGYPRHAWRFDLRVSIANSPDYRATFPIFVARGEPT